jgi:hypothetical protein
VFWWCPRSFAFPFTFSLSFSDWSNFFSLSSIYDTLLWTFYSIRKSFNWVFIWLLNKILICFSQNFYIYWISLSYSELSSLLHLTLYLNSLWVHPSVYLYSLWIHSGVYTMPFGGDMLLCVCVGIYVSEAKFLVGSFSVLTLSVRFFIIWEQNWTMCRMRYIL